MSTLRGVSPLAGVMCGCVAIGAAWPAYPADPDKDPRGWGEVQFGMTQAQVVDALQGAARVGEDINRPQPLMLSPNIPNLPKALSEAERIVEAAGRDENEANAKTATARLLLTLIKPRSWTQYETEESLSPRPPSMRKRGISTRVSGTLQEFVDLGARPRSLLVQPRGKNSAAIHMRGDLLDEKSKEHVLQVEQAILDLNEHLEAEAGPRPGVLKIRDIQVRGITLRPRVDFVDGVVSRIELSTPGADNPMTPENPNGFGIHLTLCDALEEKFGKPDEQGTTGSDRHSVWRFPQTVVTCSVHRLGNSIRYEPPSEANASGVDKL
jgi:hypothetical protein